MRSLGQAIFPMLALWLIPALALPQERPSEWGWGMHPMMCGAWGFGMMFMMVLFWGLIIVALVLAIRWLIGQGKDSRTDSAAEILRQRYARGEINKEEFDAKRRDLSA
jgi:putative membrane protein